MVFKLLSQRSNKSKPTPGSHLWINHCPKKSFRPPTWTTDVLVLNQAEGSNGPHSYCECINSILLAYIPGMWCQWWYYVMGQLIIRLAITFSWCWDRIRTIDFQLECEVKKAPKYKVAERICVCLGPGEILEGADSIWPKAVPRCIASSNKLSAARNQTRTKCNACFEEIKGHTTDWHGFNVNKDLAPSNNVSHICLLCLLPLPKNLLGMGAPGGGLSICIYISIYLYIYISIIYIYILYVVDIYI